MIGETIVEVRVLTRGRSDPVHVCIITSDGKQSTYDEDFDYIPEAEAFAAGMRQGLQWFVNGSQFVPRRASVDYRELLKKYMDHVRNEEGATLTDTITVPPLGADKPHVELSNDEYFALEQIERELP